ncbi:hypothetical protein [Deinococcus arenicola]|uniref:Uncharacterized protein n=1 Tax=Deinococcus arenicola TaxID=2994950 RepID=A0ABU4DKQ6_9DEIO|nr:hypothetical protein [Deinococcus sp. ZS9-10]MDV6373002.1 hypothetical protein [Deinococcus sp. ZS9-10]
MTPPQTERQRISEINAARALRQHTAFLGLFLEPRSPSELGFQAKMTTGGNQLSRSTHSFLSVDI